jgi:hypothetical protein
MDKRTGASPSRLKAYLTNPCLYDLSLRFAHARRTRLLSVGRIQAPFIQRSMTLPGFLLSVKEFQKKLSKMTVPAPASRRQEPLLIGTLLFCNRSILPLLALGDALFTMICVCTRTRTSLR